MGHTGGWDRRAPAGRGTLHLSAHSPPAACPGLPAAHATQYFPMGSSQSNSRTNPEKKTRLRQGSGALRASQGSLLRQPGASPCPGLPKAWGPLPSQAGPWGTPLWAEGRLLGGSGASMVMDMGRSVACLDSVHSIVEGNVQ